MIDPLYQIHSLILVLYLIQDLFRRRSRVPPRSLFLLLFGHKSKRKRSGLRNLSWDLFWYHAWVHGSSCTEETLMRPKP